jgi:hypothetical protein
MDLQERIELAKSDLVSALLKNNISYGKALSYAITYTQEFVETGAYSKEAYDDLNDFGLDTNRLFKDIVEAIGQYVLTFAERARLEFERDQAELTPEEANQRKEDILALEEMETLCNGKKECSVTDEQKELIQVLTEGLDPEKFDLNTKPSVTKEEIEQFRVLGKKFGLDEELIARHIDKATSGTPTSYVQRIISRQNVIDERRSKGLFAINSIRSRGNFKVKERV